MAFYELVTKRRLKLCITQNYQDHMFFYTHHENHENTSRSIFLLTIYQNTQINLVKSTWVQILSTAVLETEDAHKNTRTIKLKGNCYHKIVFVKS